MVQEARRLDRTWLCSVVFLDIVDYSSQPVDTQIGWKTFFNDCLAEVLRSVGTDDRVVLDTGDGAVICFLGDPETALVSSLSILNRFKEKDAGTGKGPQIRIGINLGPIRLLSDINGNLNAVGDGINVGQRIMAFAAGNQLLISRSYFEVISRLTEDYEKMFRFDGVRQDKHIREHAVYALVGPAHALETGTRPAETVAREWDENLLERIRALLAEYVGPIAKMMVARAAAKAGSKEELCAALAQQIPSDKERAVFVAKCRV